jgi:hypothetical protein
MELPERDAAAEEHFVRACEQGETEPLVAAIEAAMEARRPMLAARVVQLLGDQVASTPALERARRAAGMILRTKTRPEDHSWSVLEDAWADVRKQRMQRIRRRMRATLNGDTDRIRRLDGRRRRR